MTDDIEILDDTETTEQESTAELVPQQDSEQEEIVWVQPGHQLYTQDTSEEKEPERDPDLYYLKYVGYADCARVGDFLFWKNRVETLDEEGFEFVKSEATSFDTDFEIVN